MSKTCFFCESRLREYKRKGRARKLRSEILFKYLLQSKPDQNESLLESILQASRARPEDEDETSSEIKFCIKCEAIITKFLDLHLQLEVIQMKIINCLNTVKDVILKPARKNGRGTSEDIRMLENAEDDPFVALAAHNISEIRKLFKNAVSESKRKCVRFPLVYLERCVYRKPIRDEPTEDPNTTNLPVVMDSDPPLEIIPNLIKTEASQDDDFDDHEPLMFPEQVDDILKLKNGKPKIAPKRKRNRKPIVVPRILRKLKGRSRRPSTIIPKKKIKANMAKVKPERRMMTKNSNMKFECEVYHYESAASDKYHFEHHLVSHETSDKSFKCSQCPDHPGFSGEQLFQLHSERHRTSHSQCSHCPEKVPCFLLAAHYRTHVDTVFQCDVCPFCTTSLESYLKHLQDFRRHSSTFKCHICQETFSSEPTLLAHLHYKHEAIKKFLCEAENCREEFFTKRRLQRHMYNRHMRNTFVCQDCGKVLRGAESFKNHQNLHTGERPHSCDQCSQSFFGKGALATHKIREHAAPKFKCDRDLCNKEYSSKHALTTHVAAVHDFGTFTCDYCNETFDTSDKLKRHKYEHTSPDMLVCQVCGKKFMTRNRVLAHMRIHNKDKSFQCSYCPQAFVVAKYLRVHLRVHSGKKYLCDHCGMAFTNPGSLSRHKKNQHEIESKTVTDPETVSS